MNTIRGKKRGGIIFKVWTASQRSPVTFHHIAKLLDVTKPTAGVALLLIGMITVTGHVASFAAGVAELLPLLFGLLAVPGNVATPVAVVARWTGKKKQNKNTVCQKCITVNFQEKIGHK